MYAIAARPIGPKRSRKGRERDIGALYRSIRNAMRHPMKSSFIRVSGR